MDFFFFFCFLRTIVSVEGFSWRLGCCYFGPFFFLKQFASYYALFIALFNGITTTIIIRRIPETFPFL